MIPRWPVLGVKRTDVVLLNFAVWLNSHAELRENAKIWADFYRDHHRELPFIIWRDASVQHFDTPTGDYKCDGCPKVWPGTGNFTLEIL